MAECLARGIPTDAPSDLLMDAVRVSREIDLTAQRRLAVTLFNLVGVTIGAMNGKPGDFWHAVSHLYGHKQIEEMKQAQHEREKLNQSLSVMGRFREIADRMEE